MHIIRPTGRAVFYFCLLSFLFLTASAAAAFGWQHGFDFRNTATPVNNPQVRLVGAQLELLATGDFTISASPSSLTVAQGNQGTSTITTAISGGFNSWISLSVSGMPTGTTVSLNPSRLLAPGAGNSTMTITVGSSTPVGTYPLTVTGNGGGTQQNATVTLTVTAQQYNYDVGMDFRSTQNYVTDPAYAVFDNCLNDGTTPQTQTNSNGYSVTWQWSQNCNAATDESNSVDPRLAGIANLFSASFSGETLTITLPQPGTYNIGFATGNAAGNQCSGGRCPNFIFRDGTSGTQLFTVNPNNPGAGHFIDAANHNWTAAQWPASNQEQQVTLSGTTLTVSIASGNAPSIAHIRITSAQQTPNFSISAAPSSLSVQQGNQGTSTITTAISGGFNSAISLSASGAPSGTTVSFNPQTIPAPGAGSSTMTVTVGSGTPTGSYPITVTGNGGGIQQNTTVTLTVTQAGGQGPSDAYLEQPYSFTLQSSFGTSPYTYQLVSGSLPPGLTMDQSGNITGTPTALGQFAFEVVTDSSQPPQQQTYNYTLNVLIAVTTYHNDNYRSGANTNETVLNPSNVNVQTFGKRSVFAVQGYVYAQPLYVPGVNIGGTLHNVVYIATEHDQVYAFDANSGQQIWQTSFISSIGNLIISTVSPSDVNCGDLVWEIGITGTPAIDTSTGTMYVVAKTKVLNKQTNQTTFYQTLHALDITTGLDKVAPLQISATAKGNGTGSVNGVLTFDPLIQAQRPGLMIQNGAVFIAFGSHCDLGNYHGWIMAFAENTLLPSGVMVDTPNGYEAGYWSSGSGLNADSAGSIYGVNGNGSFDANTGGSDYGDSILRLTWSSASKTFTVADYFTPWDQWSLNQNDQDLGSGGIVLLPDQPGKTYPHLLVQAGKEGTIDLVNRDNMGHFNPGGDTQIVQTLPFAIGGIWGAPAFWNNSVYFGGAYDYLKAFSFDPNAQQLSNGFTSRSSESYGYPGPTPSVSANGDANGIVWMIESDTFQTNGNAILRAYDATNLGKELYNSGQNSGRDQAGLAVKFAVPTVADGYVFVGAQNEVDMYGPLQ